MSHEAVMKLKEKKRWD